MTHGCARPPRAAVGHALPAHRSAGNLRLSRRRPARGPSLHRGPPPAPRRRSVEGHRGRPGGMTTNIPPHNLDEIIDATCAIIDQPRITVDELCLIIKGPDFPTGGVITGREGILSYLKTGKGIVRTRGKAHTEELKGGMEQI